MSTFTGWKNQMENNGKEINKSETSETCLSSEFNIFQDIFRFPILFTNLMVDAFILKIIKYWRSRNTSMLFYEKYKSLIWNGTNDYCFVGRMVVGFPVKSVNHILKMLLN